MELMASFQGERQERREVGKTKVGLIRKRVKDTEREYRSL